MHPLSRSRCKPSVGQRFSAGAIEYELQGKIGDGAVGLVRKARAKRTGRIVAVKFLAPDPKYIDENAFDDVAQRFRREGLRGSGLDHESLVKVIAYEDNRGGEAFAKRAVRNPFLVLEHVPGPTLESLIRRLGEKNDATHITPQTLDIASRIARSLQYLHSRKIVHRDVKPANIFLSSAAPNRRPSVVKLGDFGVTKWGEFLALAASGTLTATSQQGLGTLKYMSPEQALRPKDVTVRSDIFSLGITLFELFTGQILPSPHHVFNIMRARTSRGSITGKLQQVDVRCPYQEEPLFELVLDMFLAGASGRPTSQRVAGNCEFYLERMIEPDV
jgi:serine/threonine-protein kinase